MTNTKKVPTLKIILADESETNVSLPWLKAHSKMVETMFLSSVGPDDVKSITLAEVQDSEQFEQIKSTIDGDLSWLMDSKIQNKGLGSLYLAIWRTMSYLDAGFTFNWESLNKYTIKDHNLLRILLLLDLLLDLSDQLKEKIQSKISELLRSADQDDVRDWERSFHSIVSGSISIGSEVIGIRLILDRIFQKCNLTYRNMFPIPSDDALPFKNKLNLNPQFIPRLREMVGSAWPWSRKLANKNIWPKGMILAGGAVITCYTDRDKSKIEPSEDLDFWIYGPTKEERKARFKTALKYLTSGVENKVIFSANHCVANLILPGDKVRMIQLIYTDKTSPEAIVIQFDLGHVKCYYDGTSLYGTDEARMALELGIVDIDPMEIKPHRLYKIFRYPFKFNHFDLTVNLLEERFGLQKEMEPTTNNELPEEMDDHASGAKMFNPSWVKTMKTQLSLYDDVKKIKKKYIHLPNGLNSKREVNLVSTILGGNFTTKSVDQLCKGVSYRPFAFSTYNGTFQMVGDCVSSSGLLIDFSQIPAVYQEQTKQIMTRTKCVRFISYTFYPNYRLDREIFHKNAVFKEPIMVRFRNVTVKSASLIQNHTIGAAKLSGQVSYVGGYTHPLMIALASLHVELFKHSMYEKGILKGWEWLDVPERNIEKDKIDGVIITRITKPTYNSGEDLFKFDRETGWTLEFNISNSDVIHGNISSSMIVDIDLILKGWISTYGRYFCCWKEVESLTVKKNLSPLFKPGKEVIGLRWKESYETTGDH